MRRTNRRLLLASVTVLLCAFSSFIAGLYVGKHRGVPFVSRKREWSIGIYGGESRFHLTSFRNIANPVLTARHVTDVSATGVADPFVVKHESAWYLFFEVLNGGTKQGDIGLATSNDTLNWKYEQIVLDEPFHLSYPYVFAWGEEYYMIPETSETYSVRLYIATDFPTRWKFVTTLLSGEPYVDPSPFRHETKWWMFVGTTPTDTLRLYYADALQGPWREHPQSPVVDGDPHSARPAGRVSTDGDRIVRYAQDDYPNYGQRVWAFEITELSTTSYHDRLLSELPVIDASGAGWNGDGMHHVDMYQTNPAQWAACVDGVREQLVFGWHQ